MRLSCQHCPTVASAHRYCYEWAKHKLWPRSYVKGCDNSCRFKHRFRHKPDDRKHCKKMFTPKAGRGVRNSPDKKKKRPHKRK